MTSQARRPESLAAAGAPATVEALVRMLLAQLADPDLNDFSVGPNSTSSAEEIILDIDLDGVRYLLMRLSREERLNVKLSPREQEIVRMVAQGHSNKIIADVLSISSWTVCTHLRRIFAKLGVGSRAAMVARLLELGGIPKRPPPQRPRRPGEVTNDHLETSCKSCDGFGPG